MRYFLPVVGLLLAFFSSSAQNDFRSRQSGNWADPDTWEEFTGASWQNTANIPDESAGVITIESFMTVSVDAAVAANQVVVLEDALLEIVSGGVLTLTEDTGEELDIAIGDGISTFNGNAVIRAGATLENQGSITSSAANFSISGEFIHNRNGGAIPPAGWASGSKLTVRGITSQAPTGFNISLSSLEWDCPAQSGSLTLDGPFLGFSQDLLITNTNDQRLVLNDNQTVNASVGGDFTIGNFADVVLANAGNTTLDVDGVITNNGILRLSIGGGTVQLNVNSDFASPGELYGSGLLVFSGTALQHAAITGGTSGQIDYLVPDDAQVDFSTSILGGTGSFTAGNDVILHFALADASGTLQNNTSGGALRVDPAGRTFGDNLELIFNGSAAQYTGDGLPSVAGMIFRVNNPAGVYLTNDLTATGDVLLTGGPLHLNGQHLVIETIVFSGTGYYLVPDENATLEILGSGSFGKLPLPAGTQSIGSLILDRSGGAASVELTSDIIVHDDLVLTDGILKLEDNILELRKDIVSVSGEIETTNTSGIHISGSGSLSAIPFRNVNNSLGTFIYDRPATTFTATENLRIYEQFGLYAGTVDNAADVIQMTDGTTIRRRDGDLSGNTPSLISGSYHVIYEGTAKTAGMELPDNTAPDELGDLIVSDGPVTIDKPAIVNGNVTLSAGSVIVDNVDLTLRGTGWTNNSGDFLHQNGTLIVESAVTISGTGTNQFDAIDIANGGSLVSENIMLSGDLIVNAGGLLDISDELFLNGDSDQQLNLQSSDINNFTVNKSAGEVFLNEPVRLNNVLRITSATNLNSDGNLFITADPNNIYGGGRVDVLPAGASVSGDVVSEWHQADTNPLGVEMYFGSTVSGARIAGLQDDILVTGGFTNADNGPVDPSLFRYDESQAGVVSNGWTAYPVTDDQAPLETGAGYLAYVMDNSPVTLDLAGILHQGDVAIPVTFTDTGIPASDGWNFISNPFASSIGWDQLNGWDKSAVRGVIAVNINGKFRYYNGSGAGQGTQLVMENGIIAKHQAFWVQAVAAGDLVIGEQAKVDPASVTPPVSPSNQMLLTLSDGTSADQALLVVSPGATADYDAGLDAPKFNNSGMDISTLSADGTPLALNFLAPLGCGESITVQLEDVASGDHTLSVNTIELFDIPYLVTLHDALLGADHNVNNQPDYTFTIDENDPATYFNRFTLQFEADLNDLVNADLSYSADGTICPGSTGTVTFPTSQAGVSYQLEINGTLYGNPQVGTGATLFFDIDPADLQPANTLKVIASPAACATPVYLNEEKSITVSDLDPQILYAGGKLVSNYTTGNTWYYGDLTNQVSTANEIVPGESGIYILVVSSGSCSQSVSYEFVVTSLEGDLDRDISVYPNPATGNYLNIYLDQWNGQEVWVDVMTMNGHILDTLHTDNGNLRLDISGLARGVYLLRIHMGDQLRMARFIRK